MGDKNSADNLPEKYQKRGITELPLADFQQPTSRSGIPQIISVQQPQPMIRYDVRVDRPPDSPSPPVLQEPFSPYAITQEAEAKLAGWMRIIVREKYPDCPPGLEYLAINDQLFIHQKVEVLEVVSSFETPNKFRIKNSFNQDIYYAQEESNLVIRNCCPSIRPFVMRIYDNFRNEVVQLHRYSLACDSCFGCLQTMEVSSPPGNLIGRIRQEWAVRPHFTIRDPNDDIIFRIKGPFPTWTCCFGDVDFEVITPDGRKNIGKITKQWAGFVREVFDDVPHFKISFSTALDVKVRALMLGASFLIDAIYVL